MAAMTAAAANVVLSGRVTDGDNAPVEFATVRIGGTAIGATTDLGGKYTLTVPQADTITVIFSCMGYTEVTERLIKPKGNVTLNARLRKKTLELEGLEVTEYKRQTGQMQTIDIGAARLTPDASGGSIEAVLSTMAGVSQKNEMSSQYMVRGGSYDENSVYINGIEIYRPQLISSGQQEGLSIINPDLVGQVEFSTGGFSAEYGDKMSSTLDITYRQPEALEGALSLSLMGGSVSFGQGNGRFSQLHGFRYKRNASMLGSLESRGEYDPQYLRFYSLPEMQDYEYDSFLTLAGDYAYFWEDEHNYIIQYNLETDEKIYCKSPFLPETVTESSEQKQYYSVYDFNFTDSYFFFINNDKIVRTDLDFENRTELDLNLGDLYKININKNRIFISYLRPNAGSTDRFPVAEIDKDGKVLKIFE